MENKMEEMKNLSQHVIALQHQNRLVEKKVDVVGVIQSKVEGKLDDTNELLTQYIEHTNQFSNDEVNSQSEELVKTIDGLKSRQENTQADLHALLEHTTVIDQALTKALEETTSQLERQQLTNLTQLGALSDRIENIDHAANRHMEHTQLTKVEEHFSAVHETVEHVNDENGASNAKIDVILGRVSERAKELETSTQQLHDMNESFAELMSTVESVLASVDEKVCQASPLYSGPSAEDITNSFRELANMDVEGLLSTLKSDDLDSDENDSDENVQHADIDNTETVEASASVDEYEADETISSEVEEQPVEEKHGFFARLFGKG
jgi:hypothetical protein